MLSTGLAIQLYVELFYEMNFEGSRQIFGVKFNFLSGSQVLPVQSHEAGVVFLPLHS